jgi:superfamily II DNA/RNA helicase
MTKTKISSKRHTGHPRSKTNPKRSLKFSKGGSFGRRKSFGGKRKYNNKNKTGLDISSFINRSVVSTEAVKHFIPENSFNDFAIDNKIKEILKVRDYENPTPIQDKVIPHILKGEDVVGLANTGTGKTAAFLIPLIHKTLQDRKQKTLILAPTRELAIQIDEEFKIFANKLHLYSVVCVGGVNIGMQIRKLKASNHFIVGTPGRIIDLIKRGRLDLSHVKNIVLDEADRMLDMGFINDIRYILEQVPSERQSLCFSATMAPEIERLVKDFLIEPVKISVKTVGAAKNIEQDVIRINGRDKVDVLAQYLEKDDFKKVIVFGKTKHGVSKLSTTLNKIGLNTESIHGDKSHIQRQKALKRFKENNVTALIATDVAARGLDINNVTHVINFDIPENYDDYIHRIGRTGRGKNKGKALTFVR